MQTLTEVARRFLEARLEWRMLTDRTRKTFADAVKVDRTEGEMRALAWVLGVDADEMNRPPDALLGVEMDPPRTVTLTRIARFDCWLAEFPATGAVGMNTEYWAAFLTNRQMIELAGACSRVLRPWSGGGRLRESDADGGVRWRGSSGGCASPCGATRLRTRRGLVMLRRR